MDLSGDLLNYADRTSRADWAERSANDGYELTAPVGNYPAGASPYGAMDMAGNAWEWVNDWVGVDYYSRAPSMNPAGPDHGDSRVLRGGGFLSLVSSVRAADRGGIGPHVRYDVGFRVCVSPK